MHFTPIASGSSGNVSLLQAGGSRWLIDLGLGPRRLAKNLEALGLGWDDIDGAILTHTHGDHLRKHSLAQLARHGIPLYCHAQHRAVMGHQFASIGEALENQQLVRLYRPHQWLELTDVFKIYPIPVSHDSGVTCAFRMQTVDALSAGQSLGFVTDLGCWQDDLVEALADVDILALEFNHDVLLERNSRRPGHLVARVLGDRGHLSNDQAADLLAAIIERSGCGLPRHLVQLHLSQDCNRPALARTAAQNILRKLDVPVEIHTASQFHAGPTIKIGPRPASLPRRVRRPLPQASPQMAQQQLWLPGWDD